MHINVLPVHDFMHVQITTLSPYQICAFGRHAYASFCESVYMYVGVCLHYCLQFYYCVVNLEFGLQDLSQTPKPLWEK